MNHKQHKKLLLGFTVLLSGILSLPLTGQDSGSRLKLTTVCIDAGHGGKDAGSVSKDKKTYEKNLTLDISRRLADKIRAGFPEVKVVMTRDTDKYITLGGRAQIANDAGANLFICIHINSTAGTSASGYSVHVLGQSSHKNRDLFDMNLELCKRENSVILLEDDYKTKYQGFDPSDPESFIFFSLIQNSQLNQSLEFAEDVSKSLNGGPIVKNRGVSQDPFWVLWSTTMPSVLIELGFISNSQDLLALRSSSKRDEIADRLFNAFKTFKKRYDGSTSDVSADNTQREQQPDASAGANGKVSEQVSKTGESASSKPKPEASQPETVRWYGIQVMSSPQKLSLKDGKYKGWKTEIVKSGKTYKYIVCKAASSDDAKRRLAEVRKNFSGAFLVEVENNSVNVLK